MNIMQKLLSLVGEQQPYKISYAYVELPKQKIAKKVFLVK